MPTIFIPNPIGIAEKARDWEMELAMREVAEDAAERARLIAPVDTGAYRASIGVESEIVDGKATARVVATVSYASAIEFGTSDTPTFAVLRRSTEGIL